MVTSPAPTDPDTASTAPVAVNGRHSLYQTRSDHFLLYGPDYDFDPTWLRQSLPAGDWWTEWGTSSDLDEGLLLHITR